MNWELSAPWCLMLLLLVPFLMWIRMSRRFRPSLRTSDAGALDTLPVSWAQRLHPILPLLFAAGMICLIVALARPRKGLEESRVETDIIDIVLVIDTSSSMQALDMSTRGKSRNRLDAAKEVVTQFIQQREDDRLSIVTFAGMPYTLNPLTLDHDWLLAHMERVQIGMVEDGTAIGTAIASAVNRLRDSEADSKLVLLLTDGSNTSPELTPENAAELAAAMDVKIYTVGCGSDGPVQVPTTDFFGRSTTTTAHLPIDEATLKRIAEITDGRYFRATNFKELNEVYAEIDSLERTKIEVDAYTVYEEFFMPFLIAGFCFLMADRILSCTRIGRSLS